MRADVDHDQSPLPGFSLATWAILALLIEQPSYQYKTGKRFEQRLGDLLDLTMSGVYAAMNRLERDGHVVRVAGGVPSSESQPKPVFAATELGVRNYRRWVLGTLGTNPQPEHVLVRLATAASEPSLQLAILDEYERCCLRQAASQRLLDLSSAPGNPAVLLHRLTEQQRRTIANGVLEWIQFARGQVLAMNPPNARPLRRPDPPSIS